MVRSAPSSPDPAFFRGRKLNTSNSNTSYSPSLKHLSQVKCLQKLPTVSPKIRKLFSLRNKRIHKQDNRLESFNSIEDASSSENTAACAKIDPHKKNGNGIKSPPSNLHIIEEREQIVTGIDIATCSTNRDNGGTKLAELVLSLLKNRRQIGGYNSVGSEDKEDDFSKIKINNLHEMTLGARENDHSMEDDETTTDFPASMPCTERLSFRKKSRETECENDDYDSDLLTPPRIVLTQDTGHWTRYITERAIVCICEGVIDRMSKRVKECVSK